MVEATMAWRPRSGVLAAAVIVRPPRRFPDLDVVAIGGRRRGRRPDASVGRSPGSSSGETRRGHMRDRADIGIDIDFRPTDRGGSGILLLPRRGRHRPRRRREVGCVGFVRMQLSKLGRQRGGQRQRRSQGRRRGDDCDDDNFDRAEGGVGESRSLSSPAAATSASTA
jgi:hypothetical protein